MPKMLSSLHRFPLNYWQKLSKSASGVGVAETALSHVGMILQIWKKVIMPTIMQTILPSNHYQLVCVSCDVMRDNVFLLLQISLITTNRL